MDEHERKMEVALKIVDTPATRALFDISITQMVANQNRMISENPHIDDNDESILVNTTVMKVISENLDIDLLFRKSAAVYTEDCTYDELVELEAMVSGVLYQKILAISPQASFAIQESIADQMQQINPKIAAALDAIVI